MRNTLALALLAALVVAAAPKASADEVAFSGNIEVGSYKRNSSGGPTYPNPNGKGRQTLQDFVLGMHFRVETDSISITSLGFWDDNGNGAQSPLKILLFDKGNFNPLLAFIDVPTGTGGTLIDGYRYFDLAEDIHLLQGDEFTVAVYYPQGNLNSNGNSGPPDWDLEPTPTFLPGLDPFISNIGIASYGEGQVYPGIPDQQGTSAGLQGPANRYHAGSFQYTPNPEPGTMVLLGGAAAVAGAIRRRRRKAQAQA